MRWLSPEVVRFNKFSQASDVWAFGCMLYEISTDGNLPFEDTSNETLVDLLARGEAPKFNKPTQFNQTIFEIMEECTKTAINQRPTFVQISQKIQNL